MLSQTLVITALKVRRKRKEIRPLIRSPFGYLLDYPKVAGGIFAAAMVILLVYGESDHKQGVHDGVLLEKDGFALEVTVYDKDIPAEFRVYPTFQGRPIEPNSVTVFIEAKRSNGMIETFEFYPEKDILRSKETVTDYHPSAVTVISEYQKKHYKWLL